MHPFLKHARFRQPQITDLIRRLVEQESPTDSPSHVNRAVDLLIEETRHIAKPKVFRADGFGRHVLLQFKAGGRDGRVLGIGHSDTVWPAGTLETMPFKAAGGRLWGPGVLDMKAGLAFFIHAVQILIENDVPLRRGVALWVVSDEETGSRSSRYLTEREARSSDAVLILEPAQGLEGALKTARKGVGHYTLRVQGHASHAGVDFAAGASAVVELARQIERLSTFTNLESGLTVNPGVIRGGTRSNVIAAEASVEIDVRVRTLRDAARIERKLRSLRPFDKRCSLQIEGGINRPPMERSRHVTRLFREAEKAAAEIGIAVQEASTGGGSDGNFTAALGVPTLDGLGAVGEGAHAANESILTRYIPERTALLAALLQRLAGRH